MVPNGLTNEVTSDIDYSKIISNPDISCWYYYDKLNNQRGPISLNDMKWLIASSQIDTNTYGWAASLEGWVKLAEHPCVLPIYYAVNDLKDPWFYMDTGMQKCGPMEREALDDLFSSYQLPPHTLVCGPSSHGNIWTEYNELPTSSEDKDDSNINDKISIEDKNSQDDSKNNLKGKDDLEESNTETYETTNKQTKHSHEGYDDDDDDEQSPNSDEESNEDEEQTKGNSKKRKVENDIERKERKKRRKVFRGLARANATTVYITGLPSDTTEVEVGTHFKRAGAIQISAEGHERVKLYMNEDGSLRGDGVVKYAREESVDLAIDLLDGAYMRQDTKLSVTRANFQYKEELEATMDANTLKRIRLAERQAQAEEGVEVRDGLKMVIILNITDPDTVRSSGDIETYEKELLEDVKEECEAMCGEVDKLRLFPLHKEGPLQILFKTTIGAQKCIQLMHNRTFDQRKLICKYYDGTDYGLQESAEEEEARLESFGDWLEGKE